MKDLLSLLIMPIPVLYLLIIIAVVFYLLKKRKAAKVMLMVSGLWFLVISTGFFPKRLINNLEKKYQQISDSTLNELPDSFNIIVLGAGFSDDKSLTPNNQLTYLALGRLVEAVRIRNKLCGMKHEACGLRIIMSGYTGRAKISQAMVYYRAGLMLGLDSAEMDISDQPKDTQAEAYEYLKKFGKQEKLIVVTDATHMPRAMKIFRDAGIDAVAAPTNFFLKHGTKESRLNWMPSADNIFTLELAVHEYVGMFWYKIRNTPSI